MAGVLTVAGIIIPANLSVYATSDLKYVDNIASIINVEEPQINSNDNKIEKSNDVIITDIADAFGMDTSDEITYSLEFGEELSKYEIKYSYNDENSTDRTEESQFNEDEIVEVRVVDNSNIRSGPGSNYTLAGHCGKGDILKVLKGTENGFIRIVNEEAEQWIIERNISYELEENTSIQRSATINFVDQSDALLAIDCPDENYIGAIVTLDPADRDLLERLVTGEAGGGDMYNAAIVAQAIRDSIVYKGFGSVAEVRTACGYSGSVSKTPTPEVMQAVSYIFDQGGCAVKHKVFYFYANKKCTSSWHESQKFIIEYGGHRYFSTWN